MPAYSFQLRFVPMIEDGSKPHTVRALRKGRSRHARQGDKLYLYSGMRTKYCRKIGEAVCSWTEGIIISETGLLLEGEGGDLFGPAEWDSFAWCDGFRPERSTLENPGGSWDLMLRWFRKTHGLPFEGMVIYWEDFKPNLAIKTPG